MYNQCISKMYTSGQSLHCINITNGSLFLQNLTDIQLGQWYVPNTLVPVPNLTHTIRVWIKESFSCNRKHLVSICAFNSLRDALYHNLNSLVVFTVRICFKSLFLHGLKYLLLYFFYLFLFVFWFFTFTITAKHPYSELYVFNKAGDVWMTAYLVCRKKTCQFVYLKIMKDGDEYTMVWRSGPHAARKTF